jgi:hypothetical protein
MRAVAISGPQVIKILYALDPYNVHHGEVSEAIAQASNQDPLFPEREDGCFRTAAILVAFAWYGSRFQPTLVGNNGKCFGVYQICPPSTDVLGRTITTNMLTNVRDASFVAVDLIRTSMLQGAARPWEERLSWLLASQDPEQATKNRGGVVKRSFDRMLLADKIAKDHFPPEFKALGTPAGILKQPRQLSA